MRATISWTLTGGVLFGLAIAFSIRQSSAQQASAPATRPAGGADQVHSITLPMIDTALPDAPGRQTVQATCSICHSNRYITMQPRFSKKAWSDEVQKMVRNYGAPVPQSQMDEIVNYLVAIRGIDQNGTH